MATNIGHLLKRARAIEERVTELAENNASVIEHTSLLEELRGVCERILFHDLESAFANKIEQQLWAALLRVNTAFRKETRLLKKHAKERIVELRKLQKNYLHFIKSSQRFYRQYILKLNAQYGGLPELRKIAQTWKDDTTQLSTHQHIDPILQQQILQSCHNTLIHLGDLSRYRETELGDGKDRKWGPAMGYYSLAAELYPHSGHSHNQMAVISREDGDHFRAVYHIYRSLASKEPYPQAKSNLELEFKRITYAGHKGQLIPNRELRDDSSSGRALIAWFVRLHSMCYQGEEFKEHDELEGEVLSHLVLELKESSLDSDLRKIILINLAAEHFATVQMRLQEQPRNIMRTYFYYLRLNVKTFFTLLQTIQPELERVTTRSDVTQRADATAPLSERITVVARRVLPGLRFYSTWFARFWRVLNANIADTLTGVEVQELWRSYAETLTLLASSFPVAQLPEDNYMLEEDTDTIGFLPFVSDDTLKIWYVDGVLKRKWSDLERNHPNIEMLMRIRDLLVDGLILTQDEEAPLDLDGGRFIYREEGLPQLASPSHETGSSPVISADTFEFPLFPPAQRDGEDNKSHSVAGASESASTTLAKDPAMNRMVDDLLGDLPEEEENLPPTPPAQAFDNVPMLNDSSCSLPSLSIGDLVNTVQNYTKSSASPGPGPPLFATPMQRVTSTSSMLAPANLPSLPDGNNNMPSIWNRTYDAMPSPASPLMQYDSDQNSMLQSDLLASRQPIHVRNGSSNSLRDSDYDSLGMLRPLAPLLGRTSAAPIELSVPTSHWGSTSLESNDFGNIDNRAPFANGNRSAYKQAYTTTGYARDVRLASPLFSPSSYSDKHHSSHRRSPAKGQGG